MGSLPALSLTLVRRFDTVTGQLNLIVALAAFMTPHE